VSLPFAAEVFRVQLRHPWLHGRRVLGGITADEYFWEPASPCWSVRRCGPQVRGWGSGEFVTYAADPPSANHRHHATQIRTGDPAHIRQRRRVGGVPLFVTSRAQNRVMDRASRIGSSRPWTASGAGNRGREKGVWGVERACHTGQHRSLQSVCVTQEIGPDLGSRVLSRYAANTV
jgi:hypothetical protein